MVGVIFHDLRSVCAKDSGIAFNENRGWACRRGWDILFIAIIAALILMAGLRYRIGIDTLIVNSHYPMMPTLGELHIEDFYRANHGRYIGAYALLRTCGTGIWPWFLLCALLLNISFAVSVARYTRYRFTAIGFYLAYSYITLNFETMIAGVAAGALLWAIPDIYSRKYGLFYIKLACGALFHLSILTFIWLPIIGLPKIRDIIISWKWIGWLIGAAIVTPLLTKFLILFTARWIDHLPWLGVLGFSSDYIISYADTMLRPEHLNWKGYVGIGFRNIIVPLCAATLLQRGSRSSASDSGSINLFFTFILIIIALLEIMRFEVKGFGRMSMLLWPIGCIAIARSLDTLVRLRELGLWILGALGAVFLCIKGLFSPMELTGERYRIELYVPYSDCITKGVCYRREWLAQEYNLKFGGYEGDLDPVYDFGFALMPGEHEIPSVLYPDCTHANMEKIRRSKCGNDSVAPVKPLHR